ncbi:F-box protein At3g07870-like [Papaver somniferum]|uniref:F-box protein At3g07870-like n=1 Tax=Papaver somniferum TaxID=3469 RepID=UPI000E6FBA76|nr:F-box protein At3g07870-like [Papaver somniferum]
MDSLPSDALLNIISRVPTESVLECKLVCKKWLTLIRESGTYFTNLHFRHLINHLYGSGNDGNNIATKALESLFFACRRDELDGPTWLFHGQKISDKISANEKYSYKENLRKVNHPPMHNELYDHFVGSCDGLICVSMHHDRVIDPIYMFNPITREYIYLPELVVAPSPDMERPFITEEGEVDLLGCVSSGFGCVRSTNEYKIVRIHFPCTVYEGHVEVYTLGSGRGWRFKGVTAIRLMKPNGAGIFANGSLYWTGDNNIVAFDLASEDFRLIPYPPCMINCVRNIDIYGLVALGGNLCFYLEKVRLQIWSLKKRSNENSDIEDIWCLDFDIGFEGVAVDREWTWFTPVLLTEAREVILIYNDSALYSYDSKTTTLKMISDDDEVSKEYFANVKAISHVHSFASLEAMGEKSKRYSVGDIWECKIAIEQLETTSLVWGGTTAQKTNTPN